MYEPREDFLLVSLSLSCKRAVTYKPSVRDIYRKAAALVFSSAMRRNFFLSSTREREKKAVILVPSARETEESFSLFRFVI